MYSTPLQVLFVCLAGKNHLVPAAACVKVFVEVVAPATMAGVCGKGLVECVGSERLVLQSVWATLTMLEAPSLLAALCLNVPYNLRLPRWPVCVSPSAR